VTNEPLLHLGVKLLAGKTLPEAPATGALKLPVENGPTGLKKSSTKQQQEVSEMKWHQHEAVALAAPAVSRQLAALAHAACSVNIFKFNFVHFAVGHRAPMQQHLLQQQLVRCFVQ
jgi:hypothetical protein